MIRSGSLSAAALLLSLTLPAQAEAPLGDWLCSGSNPGESRSYKGYVNVLRSGETYTVLWRFGTTTYLGTGLDLGDAFAVSFIQPSNDSQIVGVALFRKQGANWVGRWTQIGGKSLGRETWSKTTAPAAGGKPGGPP